VSSPQLRRDAAQRYESAEVLRNRDDQRFLRTEVTKEGGFVHAGDVGDFTRRRSPLALLGDDLAGGRKNSFARLLGGSGFYRINGASRLDHG
jgi:hypothetical protein